MHYRGGELTFAEVWTGFLAIPKWGRRLKTNIIPAFARERETGHRVLESTDSPAAVSPRRLRHASFGLFCTYARSPFPRQNDNEQTRRTCVRVSILGDTRSDDGCTIVIITFKHPRLVLGVVGCGDEKSLVGMKYCLNRYYVFK